METILAAPILSSRNGQRTVTRDGDDFVFLDIPYQIEVRFCRLRERGAGLVGRVKVTAIQTIRGRPEPGRVLAWQDVTLSAPSSRDKLADVLNKDVMSTADTGGGKPVAPMMTRQTKSGPVEVADWTRFVEDCCFQVARALQEDGSFVQVGAMDTTNQADEYLIPPLVLRSDASMLYAPAGSAKSFLAAALALHTEGVPVLPFTLPADPVPTLTCDWEWSPEEADKRIKAICRGAKVSAHTLTYRRMAGSLADAGDVLRTEIRRRGIGLLIVDSLQMAIGDQDGGDPSAGIIRLMNVVRSFNVATLMIDHPRKGATDDDLSPYGSAYKGNLMRCTWKLKRIQADQQELRLGLFLDHTSNVPPHAPVGLKLTFDRAFWPNGPLRGLTFSEDDPRLVAGFSSMLNDTEKIEQVLKDGALDIPTLTSRAGIKSQAQTRARLNDHRDKKFVKLPEGKWANKAPAGLTP